MFSALKRIYWQLSGGFGIPGEYLPDYLFLIQQYWMIFGKFRLFIRPRTYGELLYSKMLRVRDPRMQLATEKVSARDYVASKIGKDVLIPLLHVGEDPALIPFCDLPDQFVIKASHASGFVLVVTDKPRIDHDDVKAQIGRWLGIDWYDVRREWGYKDIPRRIIVEKLMLDRGELPANYRFHVFDGRVRLVHVNERVPLPEVILIKNVNPTNDWFDENFCPLVVQLDETKPPAATLPRKPDNFAELSRLAVKLAEDFEYCRVDLYSVDGHIYFGEITQYPSGGMRRFTPPDFDLALGATWRKGTPIPKRFYLQPGSSAHGSRDLHSSQSALSR